MTTSGRPALGFVYLLAGGALLIALTFMRYGVGELGWIVFTPLLVFLHRGATVRRHLALFAALVVGWSLAVAKIVTGEISFAAVPVFSIPMALLSLVALAIGSLVHRRLGARAGAYAFASTIVVTGWIAYAYTPLASWGVLAHTQIDNLALIQMVALTGLGGLTFLVALGSGLTAAAWAAGARTVRIDFAIFVVIVAAALGYGQFRVGHPSPGAPIRVGGVVSPVMHRDFRAAMDDTETLRRLDDELFARSARAADSGARIVVWNEVATVVNPATEAALTSRGRAFAQDRGVLMVMAYGVVDSIRPFHYVNKYRVYMPDGSLADEYQKRHPVPMDPNTPATAHARVIPFAGTRVSGGICYDYSFPEIARDNATEGAELALVPASDWPGIDPEHARMALMNAVAAGLPMVRPVRASTSIASDQYGRILASQRFDGINDGVMVATVPAARVATVYARTGEIVPVLALGFSLWSVVRALTSRARRSELEHHASGEPVPLA